VTFLASPTGLIFLGGRVDITYGPSTLDIKLSGELQYECTHDIDENVPPEEGLVFCRKLHSTATAYVPPGYYQAIVTATTAGHAVPIATITAAANPTLPTLFLGVNGSLSTSPPGEDGSGKAFRVQWFGWIASSASVLIYFLL
jgi:hypothetical protein